MTVAESIASKFNIKVKHLPRGKNYTEAVADFSWNCESQWTQLLNAGDNHGYVLTSNDAGNLYLTKSGRDAEYWNFIPAEGMNDGRQRMKFETRSGATALPSFSIEKLERCYVQRNCNDVTGRCIKMVRWLVRVTSNLPHGKTGTNCR